MKKTIYILIIFILSCSSNLLAGEIIDTQFSEISDIYNVEYTGEVVKLTISGIRPVAGSLTGGRVINIGPPLFSSQAINQPTVLRDGSVYKMWLSGGYSGVARIGYAFSYDGLNWTIYSNTSLAGLRGAVIGPENGPLFCADDENDSTVIKDGLIYKMWFGGQQTGTFRIGYATSSDGINWTVYSNASGTKGSVLEGGSPGFASSQVQDPMVIKDGSIYKMWFTGIAGSISRIGYATSSDGINWTIYSNTSNTNGSIIDVGKPSFASNNVYDPCVIKDGTSYKMWFTGSKDGERIGYATSSDGINWSIHSNSGNPNGSFLDRGYPSFLSANVGAPTVIRDGAQYKIWYDNNSDGIGYGMITFDQSGYYTSS
ncbi:MAG: hypothetical protein KKH98_13265, partial [Spirochaetes bacterium]|nr:hypothetical protein [Spirochaetota bacterium]